MDQDTVIISLLAEVLHLQGVYDAADAADYLEKLCHIFADMDLVECALWPHVQQRLVMRNREHTVTIH